jgi:L-ascorbate metabolism protein UlaG (beta-lactamase superfamily)
MKITFYGHACFGVEIAGKHLLFDPFVSPNELAKDIDVDAIPADYILLSHGHVDHVADATRIGLRTGAKVISNFEVVSWFGAKGLENGHPMNHGGQWKFDFGTVKYVNAVHSSVLPDGTYGGNPGGFVISSDEGTFYYAGDTALTMDMQLIGRVFDLDFAILPIGDNFTMGVDDAIIAAEFIKCNKIVGMHYDTFGFIEVDKAAAKAKFTAAECELILLDIGSTKDI